jgi:hypothetical protein
MTRTTEHAKRTYLCGNPFCKLNRMIQRGEQYAMIHDLYTSLRVHSACADKHWPDAELTVRVPDSGACGWPELVDEHLFMDGR